MKMKIQQVCGCRPGGRLHDVCGLWWAGWRTVVVRACVRACVIGLLMPHNHVDCNSEACCPLAAADLFNQFNLNLI